jgi:DNA repair protein RAD5
MLVSVAADDSGWQESPSQAVLFADEIAAVRAVLGGTLSEASIIAALSQCGGNAERAINAILDDAEVVSAPKRAKVELDVGGVPVQVPVAVKVKAESIDVGAVAPAAVKVKAEPIDGDVVGSQQSDGSSAKATAKMKSEPAEWSAKTPDRFVPDARSVGAPVAVASAGAGISIVPRQNKRPRQEVGTIELTTTHPVPYLNSRPIRALPPMPPMGGDGEVYDPKPIQMVPPLEIQMHDPRTTLPAPSPIDIEMYQQPPRPPPVDVEMCEQRSRPRPRPLRAVVPASVTDMRMVVAPPDGEFGDFPVERDWMLVGKSYVPGLSTNRGRRRLDAGEIVHFAFPSYEKIYGGLKMTAKKAAALAQIVRFSTKRAGEVLLKSSYHACLFLRFFCSNCYSLLLSHSL